MTTTEMNNDIRYLVTTYLFTIEFTIYSDANSNLSTSQCIVVYLEQFKFVLNCHTNVQYMGENGNFCDCTCNELVTIKSSE